MVEKSDLLLQALDSAALDDKVTADKVTKFVFNDDVENKDWLGYWLGVIMSEKFQNILKKEAGNMSPERLKKLEELLDAIGASERILEKGRQEGRQEGLQEVFALLEKGCSLSEAKEKLLVNA